jgi:hypothetical protein
MMQGFSLSFYFSTAILMFVGDNGVARSMEYVTKINASHLSAVCRPVAMAAIFSCREIQ